MRGTGSFWLMASTAVLALAPTGPGVREPQNRRAVIQHGDGSGT